ncbi:MAG TPA: S9 family peptidase, partial [Candidatus Polarisedimenticolia bacterium]|nr:S9 family peptidase [Candidatus Polarisedimenticolia bacterium]
MRTAAPSTIAALVLAALCIAAVPAIAAPAQAAASGGAGGKRPVTIDDFDALLDVSDPAIAPDGGWVAYTVTRVDRKRDTTDDDIWMTSWDGRRTVRLTSSKVNENTPAFSPDGKFIAFLSRREHKDDERQLWLMSREGGEGERVTDLPGGVTDYVFSPDGTHVALVADDPDPENAPPSGPADGDEDEETTPKPIVIDRYQFKADIDGYLGTQRSHLYVLDLATRKVVQVTQGQYDDHLPSWSPDGKTIVFVSKRGADPDRDDNYDLFLVDAKAGATPRRLTVNEVPDASPDWESRPVFSPDGASIAYLEGGPLKDIYYAGFHLAVIPAAGGARRMVVPDLDRNMNKPFWSPDGKSILFLLEDDGSVHLARVPAAGGRVERVLSGPRTVIDAVQARDGRLAVL